MAAVIVVVIVAVAGGVAAGYWLAERGRSATSERRVGVRRILLPVTGPEISRREFDAAIRLAKSEGATIVPAFLARVPRTVPLDSAIVAERSYEMPLIEVIERRASAEGVRVDSLTARGRTYRDALRRLLDSESFDGVVVSAANGRRRGLSSGDLEWLLEQVPAEVLVLRPVHDDYGRVSAAVLDGNSELAQSGGRNGHVVRDTASGVGSNEVMRWPDRMSPDRT